MTIKKNQESHIDKKTLITMGMTASLDIRKKYWSDLKNPICIYDLCEKQNVSVRFNDINMEGMYVKEPKPTIHLSALRPLARRKFTCAHELGHHIFGHGSTIDELRDEQLKYSDRPPNEIIADAFAAFLLMPTLGLREAFTIRKLKPENARALDIYFIACNFGVGQATLVNHLAYGINMISSQKREVLGKITPKAIRTEILGKIVSEPLIVVDDYWKSPTLDIEENTLLLLPKNVVVDAKVLMPEMEVNLGRVFRPTKTGITRVIIPNTAGAIYIRISRRQYTGLAKYRHLEDAIDD
jgi:Zn-dependent peptidase ImmA (M78 family)